MEQAEAKKVQEQKGKGSKGTTKRSGKQSTTKEVGKLPPTFIATSSVSDDQEVSVEERRENS